MPTFRSGIGGSTGSGTIIQPDQPPGTVAGDEVLIVAGFDTSGITVTKPASVTQIRLDSAGGFPVYIWRFTAVTSGTATIGTFNASSATRCVYATAAYSGTVAGVTDGSNGAGYTTLATATDAPGGLVPTRLDDVLVAAFWTAATSSWTAPAGMTARASVSPTGLALVLYDQTLSSAAATPTKTATASASSSFRVGQQVLLKGTAPVADYVPALML